MPQQRCPNKQEAVLLTWPLSGWGGLWFDWLVIFVVVILQISLIHLDGGGWCVEIWVRCGGTFCGWWTCPVMAWAGSDTWRCRSGSHSAWLTSDTPTAAKCTKVNHQVKRALLHLVTWDSSIKNQLFTSFVFDLYNTIIMNIIWKLMLGWGK